MMDTNEEANDELDILEVYDALPKGQEYSVIGCIEPDKYKYMLMCFLEFLKKVGVLKSIADIDLDDFDDFKQTNAEYLYEKYGDGKNVISMYKFYGAYPTDTKAKNAALKLKNSSMFQGNVYVQKAGAWVPFNPPDNFINNTICSDKKMNELMNQHVKNKEKTRKMMEDQKKALLQKKNNAGKKKNIVDLQIPSSKDIQLMETIKDYMSTSEGLMGKGIISDEFKKHYDDVQGSIDNAYKPDLPIEPIKLVEDRIKALKITDIEAKEASKEEEIKK
jgi:predicted protein tyrosine phosphatase